MSTTTVQALVPGGGAKAGPPLGPQLGPLGVNIGRVVSEINKKTSIFDGMNVPVKIIVDTTTKDFEISIGTPPASGLIKKEANLEKGSGKAKHEMVANLLIEQIIKIAKMKETVTLGISLKEKIKEIVGTCQSMGIFVEGKPAKEIIKDIDMGVFDEEIRLEKTELTAEELAKLEQEKKMFAEELAKHKAELDKIAKDILAEMTGKPRGEIKAKLVLAGIPDDMITALLSVEGVAAATTTDSKTATASTTATKGEVKKEVKKEEKKK